MQRTRLDVALLALLGGGCASTSLPVHAPSSAAASSTPEGQAAAVPAAVAPGGATAHRLTITAEGAPQLAAPTTPRVAQSGWAAPRCARLAGLCLEDVGRMMSFLGAQAEQSRLAIDEVRLAYSTRFIDLCATATQETLTCVETADNVFTGIARCGVNRGRAFSDMLIGGEASGFALRWSTGEREVTDAAGAAALRAAMVGAWSQREVGTWTFTAAGAATITNRGSGTPDTYQFTTTSRAHAVSEPLQFWSAVVDGDRLYMTPTSDATQSEAQPIVEGGVTIGIQGGLWAIQDLHGTPRCTGFSWWGQPVQSARCAWEGQGDARRLLIMASFGHDLRTGEPAPAAPLRFREMAGHLVNNNQFNHFQRVRAGGAAPTP